MTINAGVWIDHRAALMVFETESGEELKKIESNVEKHVRSAGGSRTSTPYGPQDVVAEDKQDRRFAQHLARYYKEVITELEKADAILVMGPGEAKTEFQKQIKNKAFRERIVGVETVDKMTERQIAAKVRKYFAAKSNS